jgi:DNA (cytosine-5)-methyltransferase 1
MLRNIPKGSFSATVSEGIDRAVESFFRGEDGKIVRRVQRRDGTTSLSSVQDTVGMIDMDLAAAFDSVWLRSSTRPTPETASAGTIRAVDLFAGCGGLSVGLEEAGRALRMKVDHVLANDFDQDVLRIYAQNFSEAECVLGPVEDLLDGEVGSRLTPNERKLRDRLGEIDVVTGGPPCQGHSDFNNRTRNDDPKNELYLKMARFCEVVRPKHVVIENVPGVERDRGRVAQRTWDQLRSIGYSVDSGIVDFSRIGVAQARRRSITLGSLVVEPRIASAVEDVHSEARSLSWAISDLEDIESGAVPFDTAPSPSEVSRARMDYLFDNDLFELPDHQRPDCHRSKSHSYVSVYGRLRSELPAPTITTGFGVMGRGRFVHPARRRTITPHEAARIQFFPDFFSFAGANRTSLHRMIGNAVPPKAGYAIGLHLLR